MRALFQILIGVATQSTVVEHDQQRLPHHRRHGARCAERTARALGVEPPPEGLAQQLERHRRQQQNHRPVHPRVLQHPPDMAVQLGEDERREVPDLFLSGQASRRPPPAKPQPTAKNSAMNSPASSAGSGDHQADDGAGVRAGDEARQERAFEREVGRVVVRAAGAT